MEIWKQIQNFEKYSISSFGNLKATNNRGREYLISITNNGNDYQRAYLYKNGKRTKFFIHRLVAQAFIPNTDPTKTQVHHIDHVRDNNGKTNLMWCTSKENNQYKIDFHKGNS